MLTPFLSAEQQGIVMFWMWKTLGYWKRLLLSFGCILLGCALQLTFPSLSVLGVPFLLAGNLFLLVKGYDSRIKLGKYSANDAWERASEEKIREIETFVKKMRRWDRSALDTSNALGKFLFIIQIPVLVVVYAASTSWVGRILAVDAAVLLFPHWFTGLRHIMRQPKLQLKIRHLNTLLEHRSVKERIQQNNIEYFLLLKGKKTKVPDDIKFRIALPGQHPDFLGFYGQIVTNSVSGKAYPYFYVVLIAKQGYGLKSAYHDYSPPSKIVKEYKKEGDVEVLVIRQKTTKTSGYHTKTRAMRRILLEGLDVAEQAAMKEA